MESLSEFWKNVKERVSNPFIFSFVVLWLIYNWKISVGLFFMEQNDFRLKGYLTIYEYIEAEIPSIDLWRPSGGALVYCIAIPILKEFIRSFNAFTNKWGSKAYFGISEDSKVPFDQYMDQIRAIETKRKDIDTLLDNTKQKDADRQKVSVELASLKTRFDTQGEQLVHQQEIVARMRDPKLLDGLWRVSTNNPADPEEYEVSINNGVWRTAYATTKIEEFYYDVRSKQSVFSRIVVTNGTHKLTAFYSLIVEENKSMTGTEDSNNVSFAYVGPYEENQALRVWNPRPAEGSVVKNKT